jgi:hypothetical protein
VTITEPLQKVVAVMQGDEFYSTWVANKAVYRTRMAIADGGELLIIAPGLKRFGEQPDVDQLIRSYGYSGTTRIMELYKTEPVLQDLTHGTAHLIHGSSEGRFTITYAPGIAARLARVVLAANDSATGSITAAEEGTRSTIRRYDKDIDEWDRRLADRQLRLKLQYASLDTTLGQLRSQSSWLAAQVSSLG